MRHWLYGLFISLLISTPLLSFAQDSLFDEGVYKEIRAEDITPEMAEWARSTADTLKRKLISLNEVTVRVPEKRNELEKVIRDAVVETKNVRDLLLMRYHLNRTLELSSLFTAGQSILAINYVLLPGIKRAIKLYEEADLPYLMAHQSLPEGEIEPPAFAYFVKSYLPDLLTTAIFSPDPNHQLRVLKFGIVWAFHDLNRSLGRQNFGPLFKRLKEKFDEVKDVQSSNETINSKLKQFILDTYEDLPVEKEYEELVKLEKRRRETKEESPKIDAASFVPNMENGRVVLSHPKNADIEDVLFSPDNRYVASYAAGRYYNDARYTESKIFDLLEQKEVMNFSDGLSWILGFRERAGFTPDGAYFYIFGYGKERSVLLYNLELKEKTLINEIHFYLDEAKVSPSGKFMVMSNKDYKTGIKNVYMLIVPTKQVILIAQFDPVRVDDFNLGAAAGIIEELQIEFPQNEGLIFMANKKSFKIYDVPHRRLILEDALSVVEGLERPVKNVVWDEANQILYVNLNTTEGLVKRFDLSNPRAGDVPTSILELSSKPSKVFDVDPQGQYVVIKKGDFADRSSDAEVAASKIGFRGWTREEYYFIDSKSGNEIWPGNFVAVFGPTISTQGNFIFMAHQIFDFREHRKLFDIERKYGDSIGAGFSHDGSQYLAYAGENVMKRYDLKTMEVKAFDLTPFEKVSNENRGWISKAIWPNHFQYVLTIQFMEKNTLRFWKVNW